MQKEELYELMMSNPAFHLATVEKDQPHCRAMLLFRADEDGIIFHTGATKDVCKQIIQNKKVELCFNDFKKNIQVRVSGELEEVDDNTFKDEICAHPSRKFLKSWRESGSLENFYEMLKVFRLSNGKAVCWTMETNFTPKTEISL